MNGTAGVLGCHTPTHCQLSCHCSGTHCRVPWTWSRRGPYTAFRRTALRERDRRSGSPTHLDTWIWGQLGLHSPFLSPSTSLSLCFSMSRWMVLRWHLRSFIWCSMSLCNPREGSCWPQKGRSQCPYLDQDREHSQPPRCWSSDLENRHRRCRVTTPCHLSGLWNCKCPEGRICVWLTSASLMILAEWSVCMRIHAVYPL